MKLMYSRKEEKNYLLALFDNQAAINSLGGELTPGEQYDVVISGRHTSGRFFGGGAKVTVVQPPGKGKK